MSNDWQNELPQFDRYSYCAGMTYAFAEIVAAGVKRLALSPPYTAAEAAVMAKPTQAIAAQFGILTYEEPELLRTLLFPAGIAQGKTVILLAKEEATLSAYLDLKRQRATAGEVIDPELGRQLAWSFGRLLSYSDAAIATMLAN